MLLQASLKGKKKGIGVLKTSISPLWRRTVFRERQALLLPKPPETRQRRGLRSSDHGGNAGAEEEADSGG